MAKSHDIKKSITRCICEFSHDDGFMVNCDNCFVWQHCACMGLHKSNLPEKYFCEVCSPRRVNYMLARDIQSKALDKFKSNSSASKKKALKKPKTKNSKSIIKSTSTKPARKLSEQLKDKKSSKATNSKAVDEDYHFEMIAVSKKKENSTKPLFITKVFDTSIKNKTKSESTCKKEDSSKVTKIGDPGTSGNVNHLVKTIELKKYNCHKCKMSFQNTDGLGRHIVTQHTKCEIKKYGTSKTESNQKHRRVAVLIHIMKINPDLTCNFCQLSFQHDTHGNGKHSLLRHIQTVHYKMKRNNCSFCSFGTSSISSLERHVLTVHDCLSIDVTSWHRCCYCDKTFTERSNLNLHMRSVHCKIKKHSCDMCGFTSTGKLKLIRHKQVMHKKKHSCDMCGFSSAGKLKLIHHKQVMHKKKNACDMCGFSTDGKLKLIRHKRVIHKIE